MFDCTLNPPEESGRKGPPDCGASYGEAVLRERLKDSRARKLAARLNDRDGVVLEYGDGLSVYAEAE